MTWTSILAVWGAVTGTVGILLQLRNYLKDRPKIAVSTRVNILADDDGRKFEVLIANHGRRPVYTDALLIEFRANSESGDQEHRWKEECREPAIQCEVKEGEGKTLYISEALLTFGDDYHFIYRVGVRDKTGKIWWSAARVGENAIFAALGSIRVRHYEEEGHADLSLFKDRRRLYTLVHTGGSARSRKYRSGWLAVRAFNREKRKMLQAVHESRQAQKREVKSA